MIRQLLPAFRHRLAQRHGGVMIFLLLGNYQKLGRFAPGMLSVLMPVRRSVEYDCAESTFLLHERPAQFTDETIAYYQTASYLYRNRLYREIGPAEQARYAGQAAMRVADVRPK